MNHCGPRVRIPMTAQRRVVVVSLSFVHFNNAVDQIIPLSRALSLL